MAMHAYESTSRPTGSRLEFDDGLDEVGVEAGLDPGDGDGERAGLVRSLGYTRVFPEIIFDRPCEN
jgi:hypothetical protein